MAWWWNIKHCGNFSLNYDFNYKGAVVWDNKFIAAYGNQNKRDDKIAKTDDRLELNSLWGKSQRRLVLFVIF
jgi:hypothetical protein